MIGSARRGLGPLVRCGAWIGWLLLCALALATAACDESDDAVSPTIDSPVSITRQEHDGRVELTVVTRHTAARNYALRLYEAPGRPVSTIDAPIQPATTARAPAAGTHSVTLSRTLINGPAPRYFTVTITDLDQGGTSAGFYAEGAEDWYNAAASATAIDTATGPGLTPLTVVPGQVAHLSGYVFWVDPAGSGILRAPQGTTTAGTSLGSAFSDVSALFSDGTRLLALTSSTVLEVLTPTGTASAAVRLNSASATHMTAAPTALLVDSANGYVYAGTTNGRIVRFNVDGSGGETLLYDTGARSVCEILSLGANLIWRQHELDGYECSLYVSLLRMASRAGGGTVTTLLNVGNGATVDSSHVRRIQVWQDVDGRGYVYYLVGEGTTGTRPVRRLAVQTLASETVVSETANDFVVHASGALYWTHSVQAQRGRIYTHDSAGWRVAHRIGAGSAASLYLNAAGTRLYLHGAQRLYEAEP